MSFSDFYFPVETTRGKILHHMGKGLIGHTWDISHAQRNTTVTKAGKKNSVILYVGPTIVFQLHIFLTLHASTAFYLSG